jgi:hypothetical protein
MAFVDENEQRLLRNVSALAFGNPFLPERIEFEKAILGDDFIPGEAVWSFRSDVTHGNRNVIAISVMVERTAANLRARLAGGKTRATQEELVLYEDLIVYLLFSRYQLPFYEAIVNSDYSAPISTPFYSEFTSDFHHFLTIDKIAFPSRYEPRHLFACFFQIRRAFHFIFMNIVGSSIASAGLRASVWQSIFSHDMRRYQRSLYDKLGDVTTLITGPTGTGKELVAKSIGLARYVPFDSHRDRFVFDPSSAFQTVNLSALSPTIIESELFGHRKGAFTGALQDRKGWLETCGPLGTVFLDEIGELDPLIQVKLLRVLQARTFQRLGDTATRRFEGKIIAATNRDLAREIAVGRFREDFFYRLCADVVKTPSLAEQLRNNAEELRHLTRFIAARVGGEREADRLSGEVTAYIQSKIGDDYAWPGNFRELEQCVRNVMLRGSYEPLKPAASGTRETLARRFLDCDFDVDELLSTYCTLAYRATPAYVDVAERLKLDRRTVKGKIDRSLLDTL